MMDRAVVPSMMKAAVLEEAGRALQIKDWPVPHPSKDELLVKMEACGVCHTDLHLREGEEEAPTYPLVLGHEGVGRVVGLGEATRRFEIGDRVGLGWIYDTCLDCSECWTGHETTCINQRARSYSLDGAFAEYALVRDSFAVPVEEHLDASEVAPWLCAGVTALAAIRKTKMGPGKTCVVFGCGGLGLYAIRIAKLYGATVIALDLSETKLAEARLNGADHTISAGSQAGQAIRDLGGADVLLNFAPSAAVWDTIVAAANQRSSIVFVALTSELVPLSMNWVIAGEHWLTGATVGSRQDLLDAMAMASQNPSTIAIEKIPLSDINVALDRMKTGQIKGRAVVDFGLS